MSDKMYYKINMFVDSQGRNIVQRIPNVEGQDTLLSGNVQIVTPDGLFPIEFAFKPNLTVEQCFETFDVELKAELERLREKAKEKNLIVTPNSSSDSNVIQFPKG